MRHKPKPIVRHNEPRKTSLGWDRPPRWDFVVPRLQTRQFEGGVGFTDPRWQEYDDEYTDRIRRR